MRLVATLAILALLTGGLLHSLIPHDDGDNHGDNHALIAESLHNAIQHEDKKILGIIATIGIFALFSIRRLRTVELNPIFFVVEPFLHHSDPRKRELKRGTAAYRKFG